MRLSCLRFVVFVSLLLFAATSLRSQEALDLKSPTPTEETSPEATPSKSSKATATPKPVKSLEETMRPEEFKAAGLDKLDENELQHLDAFLQGYRESAKKKAAEQAQAQAQ